MHITIRVHLYTQVYGHCTVEGSTPRDQQGAGAHGGAKRDGDLQGYGLGEKRMVWERPGPKTQGATLEQLDRDFQPCWLDRLSWSEQNP